MAANPSKLNGRVLLLLALALCVALGIVIAAGVDAGSDDADVRRGSLYALGAVALAMALGAVEWWRRRGDRSAVSVLRQDADVSSEIKSLLAREQQDHARMWALLSTMDIGLLYMSIDERVIYCNPAFLRIWRVPPGPGVIGAGIEELLAVTGCTLARPGEQSRYVLRAPQEGETQVKLDLPLADGRLITQQSHPVTDGAGRTRVPPARLAALRSLHGGIARQPFIRVRLRAWVARYPLPWARRIAARAGRMDRAMALTGYGFDGGRSWNVSLAHAPT